MGRAAAPDGADAGAGAGPPTAAGAGAAAGARSPGGSSDSTDGWYLGHWPRCQESERADVRRRWSGWRWDWQWRTGRHGWR